MTDDNDKTVFRQPSVQSDRTMIRPTPGRRGSGSSPAAQSPQQPVSPQHSPVEPKMGVEAAYFKTVRGLNPLVNVAATTLAVFEKVRQAVSHNDVGDLHQRLVNEIKQFDKYAREQGIQSELVLSARYVLCTVLDEAVLNTPWGSESTWTQRTLLSAFHNETSGGEKFFMILDRMRQAPAQNLDMLELMYICLSLGFEGKYRVSHNGRDKAEQIREEIFSVIRSYRGDYERSLSPTWQGLGKIRNTLAEYLPIWVVASVIGVVLLLGYSGFRFWLYRSSAPVIEQLVEVRQAADKSKPSGLGIDK